MTDAKDKKINDLTKQITQNNSTITSLNQQISNLKTENNNKEAKIKSLTNDVANREKTIKDLNSKLSEKQNNLDNLNKQLTEKTNSEKNKNEENAKLNNNINKLKEELNKLKIDTENKIKELATKDSKIKELQDKIKSKEEELKKLNQNNKIISLENENLKKIIVIPTKPIQNEKNHNDIIINFKTIKSIKEGWLLKFSEIGLKYFNETIKCPKIGILGNKRIGKSFLLSKLFGFSYPLIPIHSDEKININIKQRKNKIKFMIFDSQGFNNPILVEKNIINEKNDINNKIEKEKEEKNNDKNKIKDNKTDENIKSLSDSYFNLTPQDLDEIKNNKNIEELITNKFLT